MNKHMKYANMCPTKITFANLKKTWCTWNEMNEITLQSHIDDQMYSHELHYICFHLYKELDHGSE